MKALHIILSFYLILLSCIPCADTKEDSVFNISIELAENHENHSHDTSKDSCSPICICNCCGHTILTYQTEMVYNFMVPTVQIRTIDLNYETKIISLFSGSIWQPPKIV